VECLTRTQDWRGSDQVRASSLVKTAVCLARPLAPLRGDAYVRSVCRHCSRSSCEALFLVLHPLTNEIRARDDAKLAAFTADEIHQCHPIQLFQIREIE
jgi:hypothetical protein